MYINAENINTLYNYVCAHIHAHTHIHIFAMVNLQFIHVVVANILDHQFSGLWSAFLHGNNIIHDRSSEDSSYYSMLQLI